MSNQNKAEREPARLVLEDVKTFQSTVASQLVPSVDLGVTISNLLQSYTVDYEGCIIATTGQNIMVNLFFANNGGGHILPIANTTDGSIKSGISMLSNLNRHRNFELSQELKDIITQISYKNRDGSVNFSKNITETVNERGMMNKPMVIVSGIDLVEILKIIYGDTIIEDGEEVGKAIYDVKVKAPLQQIANTGSSNCILSIDRYSEADIYQLANAVGLGVQQTNGINMIKARK